ncbi:hypothetical protein EVAR_93320_1 [Eumeta japonica]|uniref:Uncharacterized protein n=1 Tax=Eumeta variegata TaxID=151549 RepID=A0A4C1USS3_EUMVA|nr:hypothetical protein EVAR_93320_1 [Eumeta japonica]
MDLRLKRIQTYRTTLSKRPYIEVAVSEKNSLERERVNSQNISLVIVEGRVALPPLNVGTQDPARNSGSWFQTRVRGDIAAALELYPYSQQPASPPSVMQNSSSSRARGTLHIVGKLHGVRNAVFRQGDRAGVWPNA